MTIVNDPPRERPTGGPVPPWVAGQLIDVRDSIHDPLKDCLLPTHIDIERWLDGQGLADELLVTIAAEGLKGAEYGKKINHSQKWAAKQMAPTGLGSLENALKADLEVLGARKGGGRTGGLKLDKFPAIAASAERFEKLRKQFIAASIEPVDLRTSWFSLVGNQGSSASCVGHAVADLIQRQRRTVLDPPSARYIWQAAKEVDGDSRPTTMVAAAGTSLRAALSVVTEHGYATELEVPSRNNTLFYGDLEDFYAGLARRKAERVFNLGLDTKCWLAWLQDRKPIVLSLAVGDGFLSTKSNPDGSEPIVAADPSGVDRFSHAVLLMGYRFAVRKDAPSSDGYSDRESGIARTAGDVLRASNGKQLPVEYLVRNSAGEGWGAGGYAWITQKTLTSQAQEAFGLLWKDDLEQASAA
jgi:hypothetical protein